MKKQMLFVVSLLSIVIGAYAQQPSTGTADTGVPIEEYVPKVIIEGKWGTGPGEFGMASRFPLGYYEQYVPTSLAVNSKGEIYILDIVNNRIQKFNDTGGFLLALQVEGLKAELKGYCVGDTCDEEPPPVGLKYDRAVLGHTEVVGVNIVIDSGDTLYYYLKRTKDGKESGEVWQFRNDKLISKTSKKNEGNSRQAMSAATYVDLKIDADVKDSPGGKDFSAVDRKNRKISFQLESGEELYGARRVLYNEASKKWAVRVRKNGKIWDKMFSASGKLLGVSEVPLLSEFQDFKGSYYFIETSSSGIMIRKNELMRKLR